MARLQPPRPPRRVRERPLAPRPAPAPGPPAPVRATRRQRRPEQTPRVARVGADQAPAPVGPGHAAPGNRPCPPRPGHGDAAALPVAEVEEEGVEAVVGRPVPLAPLTRGAHAFPAIPGAPPLPRPRTDVGAEGRVLSANAENTPSPRRRSRSSLVPPRREGMRGLGPSVVASLLSPCAQGSSDGEGPEPKVGHKAPYRLSSCTLGQGLSPRLPCDLRPVTGVTPVCVWSSTRRAWGPVGGEEGGVYCRRRGSVGRLRKMMGADFRDGG